jgi:hypothetical protein
MPLESGKKCPCAHLKDGILGARIAIGESSISSSASGAQMCVRF